MKIDLIGKLGLSMLLGLGGFFLFYNIIETKVLISKKSTDSKFSKLLKMLFMTLLSVGITWMVFSFSEIVKQSPVKITVIIPLIMITSSIVILKTEAESFSMI